MARKRDELRGRKGRARGASGSAGALVPDALRLKENGMSSADDDVTDEGQIHRRVLPLDCVIRISEKFGFVSAR